MLKQCTVIFTGLCAVAALGSGCASTWSPAVESGAEPMQWHDSSNIPIARQLTTIRGFKETGTTIPTKLKNIVFGKRVDDTTIVRPVAIAVGPDNRIAIADIGHPCVHLYVPSEHRYRKISSAGPDLLRTPVNVVFDNESRLYVSDSSNRSIYVFDRAGEYLFLIKKAGNEPLQRPTGLSYDRGRRILYAVDTLANKVYAFNTSGAFLFSFGGPGENNGQFNYPTHIIAAPDGHLYLVDAMNFRIQVFDASGAFLTSFGRHGNGSGDFAMPKGIAVDRSGVIYVVDTLFDNIQLFNVTGGFLFTIGSRGSGKGEFSMPSGLYLDNENKLYVCDTYNQRVQIIQVLGGKQ